MIIVGDETGDAGRGILDGDLIGEGMLCDRSMRGCLVLDGDVIILVRNCTPATVNSTRVDNI